MNCPKCGTDAGESKFCPECGTKMEGDTGISASNEETSASVTNEPDNLATANEPYVISKVPESAEKSSNKVKKLLIPIAAIAIVIVIAAIFAIVYNYSSVTTKTLIGTWVNESKGSSFIFYEGGNGKAKLIEDNELGIESIPFDWALDDNKNLKLTINFLFFEKTASFKVDKRGKTLTLTCNDDTIGDVGEKYVLVKDGKLKAESKETTKDNKNAKKTDIKADYDEDAYEAALNAGEDGEGTTEKAVEVTDKDFKVTEFLYDNGWGDTLCYLVIKNNSKVSVDISANGIAKNSAGKTISADDLDIDVIGPGEETIGYFYFENAENVSDVEYTLSYKTKPNYEPVLGNLSLEKTISGENVIVTVTNNGDIAAEFVEAYALFFDSNGKVIDYDSTYITDDDSEIKPGVTLSEQMNTYEDFASVEVYLTGRS